MFFTTGGAEAVESAWKLARQYFLALGQPDRVKVISRHTAYHGATIGALNITGLDAIKEPFLPLLNGLGRHVPNTLEAQRADPDDPLAGADAIEAMIIAEGPETVAAVYLEPVQNAGGCLVPPDGYFQRVREICDRHGVLLVSDEVICAFGRLGDWFGASRLGYQPDMLTFAKGLTSGYAPLGGVLVSDRLAEPFLAAGTLLPPRHHLRRPPGELRGGAGQPRRDGGARTSPVGCWASRTSSARRSTRLTDLPIVREVRGMGYFYGIELTKNGDRLQRRRVRLADPRLPVEPAPRARPDLSGRRPGRPGHPALAVAGRRARGVRRDLEHAPPGAAGGLEGARPVTPSSVGVPRRSRTDERRVALTPDGVREMEAHGVDGARAGGRRASAPASPTRPTRTPAPRSSPTPRRCGRGPGWS